MPFLPTMVYGNPVNLSTAKITAIVDQQIDKANNYVVQLASAVDDLTPSEIIPVWPTVDGAPVPITTTPPELAEVAWTMPALPAAFTGSLDISAYVPEPFEQDAPVLSFDSPPAAFTETAPDSPGITTSFDDPTLSLNLPAAPSLLSINVRSFSGVDIPTIDFNIPELTLQPPVVQSYVPGSSYTSALLTAINAELLDRVTNGGTGIGAAAEQALWDRGREREYRQNNDALAELDRMETLGFQMPTGIYLAARTKLITEMNYNAANLSREIMIAQAELEQRNVQFALEQATRLEGLQIEQNNAVEQRLFEAAKYATQAGVEIYNARVRAYQTLVDAYKGRVQIYEAQIRAQIARVEAYQAEVSAEETKSRVNLATVELFKARIDAELANVDVFKARIAAIQSKADIEKLKVEIYGQQIKAYGSKVNAYTAGVEAFKARVQAETEKQNAFTAQVNAYRAEVDANVRAMEGKIAEYQARLRAKEVEYEGYKAEVDAQAARARAIADSNRSLTDSFSSEVQGISAYNDALTKQWQAELDQAQRVTEIGVSAAKANAELYQTTRSLALDAAKVGASVSAQLGASALGTMSMSESFSQSNSASYNTSYSYSESTSQIETISISA